jgi:hypothetical protein
MPIKWKDSLAAGLAGGLVIWTGVHKSEECLRDHWCQQPPTHMPDLPHPHYRLTAASTSPVVTDTGSTAF